MTSKNVKFKWTDEHQEAFDDIKKIICREVMLTFSDFSKPFHIYTDASDTQLGAVKLLPLPHPPVRARTDARTNPSAQRATQLRSVLARVYAVSRQNQITTFVP
jgi:hypothetical protein